MEPIDSIISHPSEFDIRQSVVSGSLIIGLLFAPSCRYPEEIWERIRKSFSPEESDAFEKEIRDIVSEEAYKQHKAEKEARLAKFDSEPLGLGFYQHLVLTPIEDLKNTLAEPIREIAIKVRVEMHIRETLEQFRGWGQVQMDAGFLRVIGEKKSRFAHCRFLSNEVFNWLGKEGIVDELRKRHITITPIVDEMIAKVESAPTTKPEPAVKGNSPEPKANQAPAEKKAHGKGKRADPRKQLVIDKALELRDNGHSSAPKIARHSAIVKIIAPEAIHTGLADIEPEDYEKRFKHKVGKIEDWIREGFKEKPPT